MRGIVLSCGPQQADLPFLNLRPDVEFYQVKPQPGKGEIDSLLASALQANATAESELGQKSAPGFDSRPDIRLIVVGDDADLNAVVLRLLRTDRLTHIPVGYVPTSEQSSIAQLWGLPIDPGHALEVALSGDIDRVPLIRNDAGGILLGLGTLGPVRGVAYCDDHNVLRGQASRIEVTPDPDNGLGLVVHVIHKRLFSRKVQTTRSRAFQLGCLPVEVTSDGIQHPRPMNKWTWYRHTEDLRLVRGL